MVVVGVKTIRLAFEQGRGGWVVVGVKTHLSHVSSKREVCGGWWQTLLLVFRVEGGGGAQRKVTTPKTSEALVAGLGGGGWWVSKGGGDVVVTWQPSQPQKRVKHSFRGWVWWLVGFKGWW